MFEQIKNKSLNIFWVYLAILTPMWGMFLLNNILCHDSLASMGGVYPRTFSIVGITGIFTSWAFHSNWNHIVGNTQVLLTLTFFISLIEKNPLSKIFALIAVSGLATWILGSANVMVVGASGLVFAMMGYLFASIILARRWLYIVALFFMGADYFYCMKVGLIPQANISFAAHFGGLIGGVFVAYITGKIMKSNKAQDMKLAM